MNVEQHTLVEGMLWQMVEDLPTETPAGYCALLRELDIPITVPWVVRVLSRWNYSRKKVQHTQAKKFTVINVCRYIDHVLAAPHLDPTKLKYLDESRFETRRVRRQYGYSPRGERINITAGAATTLQVPTRVFALICAIVVFYFAGDDFRESISFTLVSLFHLFLSLRCIHDSSCARR
jgi:hypothetical protein